MMRLPWWLSGKESTCQCRRCGFDPWAGKIPLEEDMSTYSSIPAWEIPWTKKPGGLKSMGLPRVWHDWATKQQQKIWWANCKLEKRMEFGEQTSSRLRVFHFLILSLSVMSNSLWLFDCSPPGSSVRGIFQAKILEWLPLLSPGDLSNRDWTHISCVSYTAGRFFTCRAVRDVLLILYIWLLQKIWEIWRKRGTSKNYRYLSMEGIILNARITINGIKTLKFQCAYSYFNVTVIWERKHCWPCHVWLW